MNKINRIPRHNILAGLFCCLSFASVQAQQKLDLQACKDLALEHNYTLKEGALDVEIARARANEAFTNYFPIISANMLGFKTTKPLISESFEIPLPIPDLPALHFDLLSHGLGVSVMAVQPVFMGGQIVNGNRMAKLGHEMTAQKFELTKEEVLLKVEQLYWNNIEVAEKMQTVDVAMKQLQAVQKQTNDFVEAGLITRNNLLKVNLKLNELKSQQFQLENIQDLVKKMLSQLIGVGADSVLYTQPAMWNEELPLTYKVSAFEAVHQSKQYTLLGDEVRLRDLERRIAIGKHLPSLSVGGSFVYHNLFHSSVNTFVGLLNVSVPISGWWGGSYQIKQAKLKLRQAQMQQTNASEQLVLQVENYYSKLEESYKQLQIAREGIAEAEENYAMSLVNYESGMTSITDLLDAQTILQENKNMQTDALIAYQVTLSHYLQKTNRYLVGKK